MRTALLIPVFVSPILSVSLTAQSIPSPAIHPNDLVRKVVNNEMKIDQRDHSHWAYEIDSKIPAPAEIKAVVETKQGNVSYVREINGHPLTGKQKSAEEMRVQRFVNDPEEQSKARRASEDDDKQSARLFAMLPDAFTFTSAGAEGDNLKLNFIPNPGFTSHSSEAYIFHKMSGFVIVNCKEDRLVEISGDLTNGVRLMGGMLGHLDAGGTFDVQRAEVGPGHWEITRLKVNMNGKILFFKTINVQQDEVHRDFARIPDDTTLEQAQAIAESKTLPGNFLASTSPSSK